MQCCPNGPSRLVSRDVHEYARDVTRRLMRTKAFIKSRDQRKRVEMRFAHLKTNHGFERMRLRGLSGAQEEFLTATVQNLKTLALRIAGHRPTGGARRLPNRTNGHLSCVRVEVADEPRRQNPGQYQPDQIPKTPSGIAR